MYILQSDAHCDAAKATNDCRGVARPWTGINIAKDGRSSKGGSPRNNKWACTRTELAIGDAETIHISGATTRTSAGPGSSEQFNIWTCGTKGIQRSLENSRRGEHHTKPLQQRA